MALLYLGCAKPGRLSGGPKDNTPPQINIKKSTPNFQTNFSPKSIKLYFDEWISLKQKTQILISPPLENRIDITQKGKHVTVEFNEKDTLKANTTYTINFGKSIVDFTEGNPVPNLVYIFSTGDKIDSLEFKGKVISSFDQKPLKDITVMLYDSNEDSIVVKSKPYYFANTDESGKFKMTHLKQGEYKVFALKDGNANYLFDLETEEIGYIDTMITVADDSLDRSITLELFTPTPKLRINEKSIAGYGKLKIEYNRKPDSIKIIESSSDIVYKEIINDSLIIWYDKNGGKDSIRLIIKNENKIDSLLFKSRKGFKTPVKLNLLNSKKSISLHPETPIKLEYNQRVTIDDSTKFSLYEEVLKEVEDTSKSIKYDTIINEIEYSIGIDSLNLRQINILGKWEESKKYKLIVLPNYFKTHYGATNDSLEISINIDKKENYSSLLCHFDSLRSDIHYLVLLKKDKKIIKTNIISGSIKKDINYTALKPGKYFFEVIEDTNKNGRWDGGDYFEKRKAEKRYSFTLNELKANWNQEEDIILKSKRIDDIKK